MQLLVESVDGVCVGTVALIQLPLGVLVGLHIFVLLVAGNGILVLGHKGGAFVVGL